VSLVSAAGGLALGCRLTAAHTGYIFPIIIGPMVMFGCAYYPWSALKGFPTVQRLVLLNPLVYASEGVRACLAPEIPHLPLWIILIVLGGVSAVLVALGLFNFQRVAVT
jgi:ABC-2 type transport system permease protein